MATSSLCSSARATVGVMFVLGVAAFAMPAAAHAATQVVTTCADSGAGSLRAAVAGALSGDVVDLSGLTCSRIALTSGAVTIPQADLAIKARGHNLLSVSGNYRSSVFRHAGAAR